MIHYSGKKKGKEQFLMLPVAVTAGERSLSKLKHIKNYLLSATSHERPPSLAILSIEHELSEIIIFIILNYYYIFFY